MSLGIGMMIDMLGGNRERVDAVQSSIGKTIKSLALDPNRHTDGALVVTFQDGSELTLWDSGRSCCESRYMRTDDDLSSFVGAILNKVEVADAPDEMDQYGEIHEVQFLRLHTSQGIATFANHNEHNGYYGGISLNASLTTP